MSGINEQVIEAEIYQIGPQGIPGEAATISVGTVTTGAAGTDASVINSGTSSAAILDFVIPQGAQGLQGIQGPQGIQGLTGATGNGIASIVKTGTVGLVDTYRITFTDNTYFDFNVTNGSSISDIEKTGTSGLVDTYTITLTNGNTHTFTVTNGAKGDKGETGEVGNGILGVNKMSTTGLVDNYRMTFTNGTYFDFDVTNAKSIVSISKISTSGLIDTYRITFNDNTNFQFPVTNGNGVSGVTLLSWVGLDKTYRMTFTNGTYFDFVVSNGAEGQAEWGGISGVLSNQHDLQDALDLKADTSQTHALKAYSDNGELLTDAEGLADVTNYAHSTYCGDQAYNLTDTKKFIKVGSPIFNNGMVCGCSESAYYGIKQSILNTIGNKKWKLKWSGKLPRSGSEQYVFGIQFNDANKRAGINIGRFNTGNNFFFNVLLDDNGTPTYSTNAYFSLDNSTEPNYDGYVEFTGTKYILGIKLEGQTSFTTTEIESTNPIAAGTSDNLLIGYKMTTGAINLQTVQLTVDNIPVFSGNKTGIDTIKPDDYTVVGSPTISADGVASNFTSSNYIKVPKEILNSVGTNSWSIEVEGVCNNYDAFAPLFSGSGHIWSDTASFFNVGRLSAANTWISYIILDNNGTKENTLIGSSDTLQASVIGQAYRQIIGYDSFAKKYYSNIEFADGTKVEKEVQSNLYLAQQSTDLCLGYNYGDYSINLNTLKVHIAENLVYQPCLKIPYTESKTGSKIVNAVYRGRVNDMASQFGYANYYTLSDTDFTLPQVELYGLIGDKTLRDSYYNGVTYWELFSNRRLEQGGSCESGVEYTLPKPFADANYVLTIPYSSKTATSFIPSATGDFIAKGTGLL
ncbi:MAG: hypothetical protein IIZ99_00020 [Turicibacter sp.]|nr:hypothetical protein [Turicibacter sp.]